MTRAGTPPATTKAGSGLVTTAPAPTTVPSPTSAITTAALPIQAPAPIVTMMQPTVLPAPAGVGAVLGAVSNANMFRDMSGLAGTQDLAKSGISGTTTAANEAGQITSANLKTEAQKAVAMGQIAADIAKSIMSYAAGQAKQNPSQTGGNINYGQDMDKRGVPGPDGSTGQGGNEKSQANPIDPGIIMKSGGPTDVLTALGGGGGAEAGAGEGAAAGAGAGALDAGALEEGAALAVLA